MTAERRRDARTRATGGEVHLRARDFGDVDFNLSERLIDFSARGACVVTVGRLRRGLRVTANVTIPGSRLPVKLDGVVRWSTTVEKGGRTAHVAGLEFERTVMAGAVSDRPAGKDPNRRHRRFAPRNVDPLVNPDGLLAAIGLKHNAARAIKDMSQGGLQIVSGEYLKPGRKVNLRLDFKVTRSVIEAEGVVRWCRRDTLSLAPRWYAGILFKRMASKSDSELRRLESYFLGGR
jgi:hypothetical protein